MSRLPHVEISRVHQDGRVACGTFVKPDPFTMRNIHSNEYEIGFNNHERLCGTDTDGEFNCQRKCWWPGGCPHRNSNDHDTSRYNVYVAKATTEGVNLQPWNGFEPQM